MLHPSFLDTWCRVVAGEEHCYEKLGTQSTAAAVNITCQNLGMTLAQVDNEEEFAFLESIITSGFANAKKLRKNKYSFRMKTD